MNILDANKQTFKLMDTVLFNERKHQRKEFDKHYSRCVEALISINGQDSSPAETKAILKELNDINKKHIQIKNLPPKK